MLRELEDEFMHHMGIYLELAQQHGLMDPVLNVAKRNVLAEHLREVVDALTERVRCLAMVLLNVRLM